MSFRASKYYGDDDGFVIFTLRVLCRTQLNVLNFGRGKCTFIFPPQNRSFVQKRFSNATIFIGPFKINDLMQQLILHRGEHLCCIAASRYTFTDLPVPHSSPVHRFLHLAFNYLCTRFFWVGGLLRLLTSWVVSGDDDCGRGRRVYYSLLTLCGT